MDSISDLLEDIVKECGGLGKFQAILLVIMFGTKVTVTWSMLMMTFGGATPDWWCNLHNVTSSSGQNKMSNSSTMQLLKQCAPPANISISCDSRSYSSDMNTLVSEVRINKSTPFNKSRSISMQQRVNHFSDKLTFLNKLNSSL